MNKDFYKKPYFNKIAWMLENFDKLGLKHTEALFVLFVIHCNDNRIALSDELLMGKLSISKTELDQLIADMVARHYLAIKATKKSVSFDVSGIFSFDPDKFAVTESKTVFEIAVELFKRPLTSLEIAKFSELLDKHGEAKVIDACRTADAYRIADIAYIEGVLRREKH